MRTRGGGERISLAANRTFTSENMGRKATHCPAGGNSGTWGFFVQDTKSTSSVSDSASSGDRIRLAFKTDDKQEFPCSVGLAVVDSGKALCETDDPDDPCSLGVKLTREK